MPRALILVADGSEEIEFVTPYDVLTRAGFEVKSAGVSLKNEIYAHMSRNVRIVPDYPKLEYVPSQPAHEYFDILILPGGALGAMGITFCETDAVLELINDFRQKGKWIAAICAATTALVAADKKRGGGGEYVQCDTVVTCHPSVAEEIVKAGWTYSGGRVAVSDDLITSQGPGTAMLFALTIVGVLCGEEKRAEVAGPMILAETL